ncbi:MAG: MGH1-like glycoside hydrolase domain-containing protein, partial [Frankiaceae bacterium]
CDDRQRLCLGLALWNGRDPILKERPFGLTGPEGNHGEDVKDYWWYLDSTPTHSWMSWRYHYPQAESPYHDLAATNGARGRGDPEYELVDTGVFDDDQYWQVSVDYAKDGPNDLLMRVRARNAGPKQATLHLLPTLWFRNTWTWAPGTPKPSLAAAEGQITAQHADLGKFAVTWSGSPQPLFCENETNAQRLFGVVNTSPYPKDGINDHVLGGAASVNPDGGGTKAALWYQLSVPAGETAEVRLRLAPQPGDVSSGFEATMAARRKEADAFYATLEPADASADERRVMRQAFAGMLWSKQYYHFDVERWLVGDAGQPVPPSNRWSGRNSRWRHVVADDVISMPDKWEYPWFAGWDLAFHCMSLAHVDPTFAKQQLLLLCHEWYMRPDGQIPAYEWDFGDLNPPVQAVAVTRVFVVDAATRGAPDWAWLIAIFNKLVINYTWWMNRQDPEGNDLFGGGFLGLDNISPFDRSHPPDFGGTLVEADGTTWMAAYCLGLLAMSGALAQYNAGFQDVAVKFFEHFWRIASAINDQGVWDEADGWYYDVIERPDGSRVPVRARSIVGVLPVMAAVAIRSNVINELPDLAARARAFVERFTADADARGGVDLADFRTEGPTGRRLISVVNRQRMERVLAKVFDPAEFLSAHGIRSVSRYHAEQPLHFTYQGFYAGLDYEPAESTIPMFGGNSNWRGPVWFPVNHLLVLALYRLDQYFGDSLLLEYPTGSGQRRRLADIAGDLSRRLVAIFLDDEHGRRPVFGATKRFQDDPAWHDLVPFYEYFHGDNGAGLGASHQTGWTGLVADLIASRRMPGLLGGPDPQTLMALLRGTRPD